MDASEQLTSQQVIAALRAREAELRAAGIRRLALFGSLARGEARADSDIDLVAEFDQSAKPDLIGLIELEQQLGDLLGREVQILLEPIQKHRLQTEVERDRVPAF